MSEQRKRLTDAEVREVWGEWFGAGDDEDPLALTVGASEPEVAIRADHLQAREDRERLVLMVRALAAALKALDGDKWGENGLITDALSLVAEVDPQ